MAVEKSAKTKSLKLIDLYQQSQQDLDQQAMSHEVELGKLQLQSDILATKQALAKAEKDLVDSKLSVPFTPGNILSAMQEVEALKAGLKALEELQVELF